VSSCQRIAIVEGKPFWYRKQNVVSFGAGRGQEGSLDSEEGLATIERDLLKISSLYVNLWVWKKCSTFRGGSGARLRRSRDGDERDFARVVAPANWWGVSSRLQDRGTAIPGRGRSLGRPTARHLSVSFGCSSHAVELRATDVSRTGGCTRSRAC